MSKKLISLSLLILIATSFMCIGYAAINSTLEINGKISAQAQNDIFIVEPTITSTTNVSNNIDVNQIYRTILDSSIYVNTLTSPFSITYQITVHNNTSTDYAFKGLTYDNTIYNNSEINYTYSEINQNDIISAGSTKNLSITLSNNSCSSNILRSFINVSFGKNYTISYDGVTISDGAQTNIAEGLTYTNNFTNPPDDFEVTMGDRELTKGTDFTYTAGTLTIPNVQGNLILKGKSAAKQYILSKVTGSTQYKGEIASGKKYNGISTANDSGVYSITDPNTGKSEKLYFYRGNVNNNYVSFAGKTWRILRINSDGSLRVILDGTAGNSQYQSQNETTGSNQTISDALNLINWKNSTVYSNLHTWYDNNLKNYSNYIQQSDYVFDTTYEEKTSTSNTSQLTCYFGSYLRVGKDGQKYEPSYAYTSDNVIKDTIGLASADEVSYAGGFWQTNNTSYFLYNSSIGNDWWTMSPSFWEKSGTNRHLAGMLVIGSQGKIFDWPKGGATLTSSLALRPVITISGNVELTGDGTSSNPFMIKGA